MCGLIGFIEPGRGDAQRVVQRMADAIRHRGPDDAGVWCASDHGVFLAHRRLSVLDVSPAGHQPMLSASLRYVVVFNGEIYNHLQLRLQLPEVAWRGHADTETLLAAIEAWGVEEALKRASGMFAFALWDRNENSLILARDRMGEKPLYYGWQGNAFLFGSELSALRMHPAWQGEVDRDALNLYTRYGFVPGPLSIFEGVRKLAPGHYLKIQVPTSRGNFPIEVPYWVASLAVRVQPDYDGSSGAAINALDDLIRQSVKRQMLSDVPLGAFLSGGVDSSTIVAMMQAESNSRVRTYSIGFEDAGFNEAPHAKAVAQHLNTDHTELMVTARDALAIVPEMPSIYSEPFGDSSQVPTYLVSKLARRDVTVCLSGDGGDELFGGYPRYFLGTKVWNAIRLLPVPMRRAFASALQGVSRLPWTSIAAPTSVPFLQILKLGDKLDKLSGMVGSRDFAELTRRMLTQHRAVDSVVIGATREPESWADVQVGRVSGLSPFAQMAFYDLVGYLCDDILVKVDRAAMAVSLETRIPLLDHHIVEFALNLPHHLKVHEGKPKWILRQVLSRYVPPALTERPKQGFSLPLGGWLRGPLRDWAECHLSKDAIKAGGFFDPEYVRSRWDAHLKGDRDWQHWLWNILMFQAWRGTSHG